MGPSHTLGLLRRNELRNRLSFSSHQVPPSYTTYIRYNINAVVDYDSRIGAPLRPFIRPRQGVGTGPTQLSRPSALRSSYSPFLVGSTQRLLGTPYIQRVGARSLPSSALPLITIGTMSTSSRTPTPTPPTVTSILMARSNPTS